MEMEDVRASLGNFQEDVYGRAMIMERCSSYTRQHWLQARIKLLSGPRFVRQLFVAYALSIEENDLLACEFYAKSPS